MKGYIQCILVSFCSLFFASCEENLLEQEQYKKVIYLLSGENNVFNYSHALNDSLTRGYLTVGSGGTKALDSDAVIKLELDQASLDAYNKKIFDVDYDKYVKLLDASRFVLPSYDIVLRAGQDAITTFFPIEIDANGLSPDTVYMIPLKIVEASDYEVNPMKSNVLYRVDLKNKYAEPRNQSYKLKGTKLVEGGAISAITTTKSVVPISTNKVRIFPENLQYSTDLNEIENKAIVLVIEKDNSIRIKPFKHLQVENTGKSYYTRDQKTGADIFNISYRYKLAEDEKWTNIEEKLTRVQ